MKQITVLDVRSTGFLLAGIGLSLLPHLGRLPLWFAALMVAVGIWRYVATARGWRLPHLAIRITLVGLVIAGIYLHFGTLIGRDAGVALLVVMLILKLLELKQRRDVMVLLLLCYFTLSTHFLYDQSIWLALYVALVTWFIFALHINLTQDQRGRLVENGRYALKLIAQALPLALILFLLFPRVPGPIWGLPLDAYSNMTGLSDEMSPGSISNLGQSDTIAFRASFEGELPEFELRYWRGPILWETDGRRWYNIDAKSNYTASSLQDLYVEELNDPVGYTVTLEPHNKRWLFALDIAGFAPDFATLTSDYQLIADKRIRERVRYEMISYTRYNTGRLTLYEIQRALRLPRYTNPQAVALGRSLRKQFGKDDEVIVAQMLQHYRNQPFVYTLTPPLLNSDNPVDQFLFESQKGFCEHYAASFVTVMRAAAIPARVVTGYQGGELNPVGNYLVVRQRDAHAWAEVWIKDRGWIRVDPTAAVAPERVEQSIESSQQQEGEAIRFGDSEPGTIANWLKQLQYGTDSLNNAWNQWVLGFDQQAQSRMLEQLGVKISSWRDIVPLLLYTVLALLALAALLTFMPKRRHTDSTQSAYNRFCRKLARKGLRRGPSESPSDFARRVIEARPDLQQPVERITATYTALRYGRHSGEGQQKRMKRLVSAFKP